MYSPKEIHNFFKTRGADSWNRSFKSKIRSMRGSLATREFSQSKMAETYRGRNDTIAEPITLTRSRSRQRWFSTSKKSLKSKYGGSKTSRLEVVSSLIIINFSQIDCLLNDMDVFEQRFQSEKHFKKTGYPRIQLEVAKNSDIKSRSPKKGNNF